MIYITRAPAEVYHLMVSMDRPTTSAEIAAARRVNPRYVRQLVEDLLTAGLVKQEGVKRWARYSPVHGVAFEVCDIIDADGKPRSLLEHAQTTGRTTASAFEARRIARLEAQGQTIDGDNFLHVHRPAGTWRIDHPVGGAFVFGPRP